MNKILKKAAAAVLAAAMTVTYSSAAIYGDRLGGSATAVSAGTELASGVWLKDSIMQSEKYIEYTPGGSVVPVVAYGSKLYGRSSLDYVSDYLKDKGYSVVAGTNGDFFELGTGISMGVVIIGGRVVADDNSRVAAGFYSDGTLRLGSPGIVTKVNIGSLKYSGIHINKQLTTTGGLVLYTSDYADDNKAEIANTSAVIRVDSNDLTIGGSVTGTVVEVVQSETTVTIPEGCMVLSMATHSAYETDTTVKDMTGLKSGDAVTISLTANKGWENVQYAVGGGSWLINNGAVQKVSDAVSDEVTARSAIGLKADGSVIFYTVDEEKATANGVRAATLAERMLELGCVYAINLDGGGSTAMGVNYPGYTNLYTVNTPSDGVQRKCANFIFLVNTAPATGETSKLFLYPSESWMLKGATQKFTAKATDENWYAADAPIVLSYDGGEMGTMDDAGSFTAGKTGIGQVYVSSLGMTGSATVNVVDSPSKITVARENGSVLTSLTAAPAAEIELTADSAYHNIDLVCSDTCFSWTVSGSIGTIDENGHFKAAYTDSEVSGSITASCGGVSATIPVTVAPQLASGKVVEGFEAASSVLTSDTTALKASLETDLTKVKYGRSSMKLDYNFTEAGSETPPSGKLNVSLDNQPTHVGLWVYGDGSGSTLNVITANGAGDPDVHSVTLDFTGWRYATAALAENTVTVKGIGLTKGASGTMTGAVWVDQIVASTGLLSDLNPPTIYGSVSGNQLTATISDNGATKITTSNITLTIDGLVSQFAFDVSSGKLTATVPTADFATHRVRLTVSDACGNLASAAYSVPGSDAGPFADMTGHWADSVVTYLYNQGVVSGLTDAAGRLVYEPDSEMTREQFAVIITKWLKTDLTAYSATQLPFADAADVSWWAADAVKAAYALGIIKGDSSGGVLNFNPGSSLTRAEAMTIIGRTQPRGYAEASLDAFTDGASVPDWAAAYIRPLISQEVVSGSNGQILPSSPVTRSQVAKILCMLV